MLDVCIVLEVCAFQLHSNCLKLPFGFRMISVLKERNMNGFQDRYEMDPFDNAEEFMEQLLCEQLDRLGCTPRFEAFEPQPVSGNFEIIK